MDNKPFMPKATAVWLVENTKISFKQIADFCDLHELEVKGIADGDVAKGIKAYNPILAGQLTREEIEACSKDNNRSLALNKKDLDIKFQKQKKGQKYIPLSKRQDRPNATLWLIKNYPDMPDGQIGKLIGITKNTVHLIRNNKYWNFSNLVPKDPVISNLCTQVDIKKAADKASRRINRIKKEINNKNIIIKD
ncbi:MAG: DUF1013 domain-containing protein [Pelagibacteraceae bacterium]|jgi:hypothetical protein|nr:cytoplasmic protein [Candidatus Pelagibacter sp.]MDP6680764.1 DUF1013 domain-containing protein [Pelagibacteraceae bacterium]MDP6710259.1 DUF1013 domain-containing protein [Pelagibacteraceae bacterium]|tara:strand:- start:540 stop:1118 length:579 start_codon:yes stop_codon:yes gene_type:complete